MIQKREIILASGSPRRRELFTQAGLTFRVLTADTDETPVEREPAKIVEELSCRKAGAVYQLVREGEMPSGVETFSGTAGSQDRKNDLQDMVIVAADTIVSMDGDILGKPKDEEDAFRMLKELSGRSHEVYTGVTILLPESDRRAEGTGIPEPFGEGRITFSVCTRVNFYPLSDEEIRDYISTGEPMDKAGSYGIQGIGARLVEGIEGDYNNVVGFPLARFIREMTAIGELSLQ